MVICAFHVSKYEGRFDGHGEFSDVEETQSSLCLGGVDEVCCQPVSASFPFYKVVECLLNSLTDCRVFYIQYLEKIDKLRKKDGLCYGNSASGSQPPSFPFVNERLNF